MFSLAPQRKHSRLYAVNQLTRPFMYNRGCKRPAFVVVVGQKKRLVLPPVICPNKVIQLSMRTPYFCSMRRFDASPSPHILFFFLSQTLFIIICHSQLHLPYNTLHNRYHINIHHTNVPTHSQPLSSLSSHLLLSS